MMMSYDRPNVEPMSSTGPVIPIWMNEEFMKKLASTPLMRRRTTVFYHAPLPANERSTVPDHTCAVVSPPSS